MSSAGLVIIAGTFVGNLATLAFQALGARSLTPADYGVLALGISLSTSVATTLGASVSTAVRRYVPVYLESGESGHLRGVLRVFRVAAVCVALVVAVPAFVLRRPLADALFKDPDLGFVLGAFVVGIVINSVILHQRAVFHAFLRAGYAVAHNVVFERLVRLLLGVGAVVLLASSQRLTGLLGAHIAALLTAAAFGVFAFRRIWHADRGVRATVPPLRGLLAFLFSAMAVDIMGSAYEYTDVVIVSLLRPPAEVGRYVAAYTLAAQPAIVGASIGAIFLPAIVGAASRGDWDSVGQLMTNSIRRIAALVAPIAAFTVVTAHPILAFTFGEDFATASPSLIILIVAILVTNLFSLYGLMLFALDRNWRALALVAFAFVTEIVVALALIPRLGLTGAALSNLTAAVVLALARLVVVRRLAPLPVMDRATVMFLVFSMIAAVPTYAVRHAVAGVGAFVTLLLCAATFGIIYALLLNRAGMLTVAEVRRALRVVRTRGQDRDDAPSTRPPQ